MPVAFVTLLGKKDDIDAFLAACPKNDGIRIVRHHAESVALVGKQDVLNEQSWD